MNHLNLIKVLTTQSHVIKQDHDTVATCDARGRESKAQRELLYILTAAHSRTRHDTLPPTAGLMSGHIQPSFTNRAGDVSTAVC